MTTTTPIDAATDDSRAKRVVVLLIWAQSVLGAQMPVHFILGGLAGNHLAPNPAFATLPITMVVLGSMLSAPVMSWVMGRWGRRTGFVIGALAGATGGGLAALALVEESFALFLFATLITGIYMSAHNFYRFAAADLASDSFRPKAISWVMAGGLMAAVLGPEFVQLFGNAMEPVPYAGAYTFLIALNLIGVLPLLLLDIPVQPRAPKGTRFGRPWREILADPRVPVAMLCAMITYALMNLVMTSTPLAMILCGFVTDDAAEVVRVHVLAMYIPSFFTGTLIARFGAPRIIAIGLALLVGAAVLALMGIELANFFIALALVGLGWNFGFIGATTMLTNAHRPEERARVQGVNDFLVFGMVTIGSFSSGALLNGIGWDAVLMAVFPAVAIAAISLLWLSRQRPV
ncbi:MFS transporter [Rhodobacteraceae bacterium NNCM2]|nr:MFS transporter [Coraliihabitans acroporae]